MPRPSKIWFRKQTGYYYVKHDGQQIRLSKDREESQQFFHELKASGRKRKKKTTPTPAKVRVTIGGLADLFLEHGRQTKAEKTFQNQRTYLQSFCDHVGKTTRVIDLDGTMLDRWSLHAGWGRSTQASARASVLACLNWGAKRNLILNNPLQGMERGGYEKRERILTPDERTKVREHLAGTRFGLFWRVLELTGARPFSEIGSLTAEMIDWQEASVTFAKHKTRHKGKKRVVYLVPEALEILRKLAIAHPSGPLFRTQKGGPWSRQTVTKRMHKLEVRLGMPHLTINATRHTFITDCLARGMGADVVAELVGNSPRTIARFYSHLEQRKDVLRDAARKAVE